MATTLRTVNDDIRLRNELVEGRPESGVMIHFSIPPQYVAIMLSSSGIVLSSVFPNADAVIFCLGKYAVKKSTPKSPPTA